MMSMYQITLKKNKLTAYVIKIRKHWQDSNTNCPKIFRYIYLDIVLMAASVR